MATSSNITCHAWTHRIRGTVHVNNEYRFIFKYGAGIYDTKMVVGGTCSGCGAEPCEELQWFRAMDQQWQEYRRDGYIGVNGRLEFLDARSQPLTVMEITRCSACNSDTHPTLMCLRLLDGRIGDCPICGDSHHDIGGCPTFDNMNPERQVQLLVGDRAGLPPLRKNLPWWDLLHRWMNDPRSGNKTLSGFPWSEEFTKEITLREDGRYVTRLQAEFDKAFDRSVLPVDESTSTINGVYTNLWCPANVRGWVQSDEANNQ